MNAAPMIYAVVRMHAAAHTRYPSHFESGSKPISKRWFDSRLNTLIRLRELRVRPTDLTT